MAENRDIRITARLHKPTGLLAAFSEDLPGLLVTGHSTDEIEAKLPGAVRELLEAKGFDVANVSLIREDEGFPEDFQPTAFIASAAYSKAA